MYYKKNRSFIYTIKNNNNRWIYYVLSVVMLAAIILIAANIVFDKNDDVKETTFEASPDEQDAETGNAADSLTMAEESTSDFQSDEKEIINSLSDWCIWVYPEENLLFVTNSDYTGEPIIKAVSLCSVAEGITSYIADKAFYVVENKVPVSENKRGIWFGIGDYYTKYQTIINNVMLHSPLCTIQYDSDSLVGDSFNLIGRQYNMLTDGIILSTISMKWFYENVPLMSDIIICDSSYVPYDQFKDEFFAGNSLKLEKAKNSDKFLEKDYCFNDGDFCYIPKEAYGLLGDPTDEDVNSWCPYEFERIVKPHDISYSFGKIGATLLDKESHYVYDFFHDIKVYGKDNLNLTQYLYIYMDYSAYSEVELKELYVDGYMAAGSYPVVLVFADLFGNIIIENVKFNITAE